MKNLKEQKAIFAMQLKKYIKAPMKFGDTVYKEKTPHKATSYLEQLIVYYEKQTRNKHWLDRFMPLKTNI